MGNFVGGSAFAMARDICEGYTSVTARTLGRMSLGELNTLAHEVDRLLRDLRGTPVAGVELREVQARNRRLQRCTAAMLVSRTRLTQLQRKQTQPAGRR